MEGKRNRMRWQSVESSTIKTVGRKIKCFFIWRWGCGQVGLGRGTNTQIFSATESEDEEPKEKFPRKGQSNSSKGLPPAPVIRPPEDRRETPGNSDRPTRIEPNIQQQQQPVCYHKCYIPYIWDCLEG
ncbi:hypothetical protein J4Q44_G00067180 [Coregonus suidteri]|uniref:Uncharacterized protein n=1 Tax=Coregonus suidteri TaxID=861788 RepID=A0AAN8MB54_9TELE